MTKQTGGPAFPMPMTMMTAEHIANEPEYGMTLRDYFAAKAMQSLMLSDRYRGIVGINRYEHWTAENAYQLADAMLKARKP